MKLLLILIAFQLAGSALSYGEELGWNYSYEVVLPGSRSEYISGSLLYNGAPLPLEFEHVVTPVGEYVFSSAHGFGPANPSSPLGKWLPACWKAGGALNLAIQEEAAIEMLSDENKEFRMTAVKRNSDESAAAILHGNLKQPPVGVGPDWFYVVYKKLWINPKKINEALKSELIQAPGPDSGVYSHR
jgi:hypothetical protein